MMNNTDSFEEIIQENIESVSNILNKYDINAQLEDKITSSLNLIEDKLVDPILYIGVVGEFSSGKTTLINSLIENDLLESDVIQSTTSAPTLIHYNDELNITSSFSNGSKVISEVENRNEANNILKKVTTKEKLAKYISLVSLGFPSNFLNQNLAVIDTPGLDSRNKRHNKVSKWMLKKFCDLPIIIIPADRPLSDSLTKFIRENLKGILSRCIFIVTKIDTILKGNSLSSKNNEEELNKYKNFIRGRLKQKLNISNPKIYYTAPKIFLEKYVKGNGEVNKEFENYITGFKQCKDKINKIIRRNRSEMIAGQVSEIFKELYTEIEKELEDKRKQYEREHKALIENKIPNLEKFIEDKIKKYIELLDVNISSAVEESKQKIDEGVEEVSTIIKNRVYNCDDRKEIKKYVKNEFSRHLKNELGRVEILYEEEVRKIEKISNTILKKFEKEFKVTYENLATLGGEVSTDKNLEYKKTINTSMRELFNTKDDLSVKGKIYNKTGAAATGGLIGTIIAPGIGTYIGGWIGVGFNQLIKKLFFSLEKIQDDTWKKISENLDPKLDTIEKDLYESFDTLKSVLKTSLKSKINDYFAEYQQLVSEKIKENKRKKEKLEKYSTMAKKDLKSIDSKSKKLNSQLQSVTNSEIEISYSNKNKPRKTIDSIFKYMQFNNFTTEPGDKIKSYFANIKTAKTMVNNNKYWKAYRKLSNMDKIDINNRLFEDLLKKAEVKYKKRLRIIIYCVLLVLIVTGSIYFGLIR